MKSSPKRYAFVVPRFAEDIAGGAETLIGKLAMHLSQRGDYVEIFTTCAKDNRSWENFFPAGEAIEYGLKVRRFAVDERNLEIWIPKQIAISEGLSLDTDEQIEWWQQGVNSAALYHHIDKERDNFDAFFFGPYLFPVTFWGSLIVPEKSFLVPCLHDETYAYLTTIASMFRLVKGCLFNAEPEKQLAKRIYSKVRGGEVGMGFEPIEIQTFENLSPYFKDNFPYLLYLGRKETGKNVQVLIDYFCDGKDEKRLPQELKLVVLGGGDFKDLYRDDALKRDDIIDLAHLSEGDKLRVLKHSKLLCQPSTNESFSIVIMEAWLAGVPVLVHSECAVTKDHVVKSNGGLYFSNEFDFAETVSTIIRDPSLQKNLAENGMIYVKTQYNWDAVLERFDLVMETILSGQSSGAGYVN